MDIISRREWGARAPRSRETVAWATRTEFIVHYSEGPTTQTVRSIQDFHMGGRGWADVGYNFLVDIEGHIYEGRGWLTVGAHAPGHNESGIGVCMIGRDGDATAAAKRSIRWLYDEAFRRSGRSLKKLGHRDVYATSCPGDQLYEWVRAGMPGPGSEDDVSAKEVWDELIDTGDGKKPWRARTVLGHLEKSQDETNAMLRQALGKIDAQALVIDKLVDQLGAARPDLEALKREIRTAIEGIDVRLAVAGGEDT